MCCIYVQIVNAEMCCIYVQIVNAEMCCIYVQIMNAEMCCIYEQIVNAEMCCIYILYIQIVNADTHNPEWPLECQICMRQIPQGQMMVIIWSNFFQNFDHTKFGHVLQSFVPAGIEPTSSWMWVWLSLLYHSAHPTVHCTVHTDHWTRYKLTF